MNPGAREALSRARHHADAALLESLEAARALLEASLLASGGMPAGRDSRAGALLGVLEDLIAAFRAGRRPTWPTELTAPLLGALDAEIARWEARSLHEPEARSVARAFVALREVLFELGLRPRAKDAPPAEPATTPPPPAGANARDPKRGARPTRPRVMRFEVEREEGAR